MLIVAHMVTVLYSLTPQRQFVFVMKAGMVLYATNLPVGTTVFLVLLASLSRSIQSVNVLQLNPASDASSQVQNLPKNATIQFVIEQIQCGTIQILRKWTTIQTSRRSTGHLEHTRAT
jgi:hypothetical protein